MSDIAILAISAKNEKGWRECIDVDGFTYSIGPDKFTDAEIDAAVEKKVIVGETSEEDGKRYLWPPKSGGGGKGWTPRPQVPEWEKYPSFAASYAEHIVKSLVECQVLQKAAEEHGAKLSDLIGLTHKALARSICATMIELRKQCQEEFGG